MSTPTLNANPSPDPKDGILASPQKTGNGLPLTSTVGSAATASPKTNALGHLPAGRKNVLLFAFSLAMYLDASSVSSTFILTAQIAQDLGLTLGQSPWILVRKNF